MTDFEMFDKMLLRIEQLVNQNTKKADKLQELTNHNRKLNTQLQTALAEITKLRNERDKDLPATAD